MSAVRAVANAESWSLTTGLKGYFSCCFSQKEAAAAPATVSGDMKVADASEPGPDSPPCRRSSSASKSNDDVRDGAAAVVDRRLEADGASYHSTGTDRASRSVAADQLSGDVISSHDTGSLYVP